MAEICLECWNKMNGTNDTEKHWKISKYLDLCEDCGKYKNVLLKPKRKCPSMMKLYGGRK